MICSGIDRASVGGWVGTVGGDGLSAGDLELEGLSGGNGHYFFRRVGGEAVEPLEVLAMGPSRVKYGQGRSSAKEIVESRESSLGKEGGVVYKKNEMISY